MKNKNRIIQLQAAYKGYRYNTERNLWRKDLQNRWQQENPKCDNIISDKIEFKEFKRKRHQKKKKDIFHILKRGNYPGNYNMNPDVTNKLP